MTCEFINRATEDPNSLSPKERLLLSVSVISTLLNRRNLGIPQDEKSGAIVDAFDVCKKSLSQVWADNDTDLAEKVACAQCVLREINWKKVARFVGEDRRSQFEIESLLLALQRFRPLIEERQAQLWDDLIKSHYELGAMMILARSRKWHELSPVQQIQHIQNSGISDAEGRRNTALAWAGHLIEENRADDEQTVEIVDLFAKQGDIDAVCELGITALNVSTGGKDIMVNAVIENGAVTLGVGKARTA